MRPGLLVASLCAVQALLTIAAAVAIRFGVEQILGFGPAVAGFGLLIAFFSSRLHHLLFGLFGPLTTALIALLISVCRWGPGDAQDPVAFLMMLTALVTTGWSIVIVLQFVSRPPETHRSPTTAYRISLLGLFVITTIACVAFAMLRILSDQSEMFWFGVYGVTIVAICYVLVARFRSRLAVSVSGVDAGVSEASRSASIAEETD